jgi:hypothetical protein
MIVEYSPVRVEVLGEEKVDKEIAIRSANIFKLLSEISGIFVPQIPGYLRQYELSTSGIFWGVTP